MNFQCEKCEQIMLKYSVNGCKKKKRERAALNDQQAFSVLVFHSKNTKMIIWLIVLLQYFSKNSSIFNFSEKTGSEIIGNKINLTGRLYNKGCCRNTNLNGENDQTSSNVAHCYCNERMYRQEHKHKSPLSVSNRLEKKALSANTLIS